jgi:hypothetical protein
MDCKRPLKNRLKSLTSAASLVGIQTNVRKFIQKGKLPVNQGNFAAALTLLSPEL